MAHLISTFLSCAVLSGAVTLMVLEVRAARRKIAAALSYREERHP